MAWGELSKKTEEPVDGHDPRVERIFEWFEKNTEPGAQLIGPAFVGVFYYDTSFWPLHVPVVFGRARVDLRRTLPTMPESIKNEVFETSEQFQRFSNRWDHCAGYGIGLMEIGRMEPRSDFFEGMLRSARQELSAAVSLLLERQPNAKAAESSQLATEMFLKSLLATQANFGDRDARRINHDVGAAMDACVSLVAEPRLQRLRPLMDEFPSMSERYAGSKPAAAALVKSYEIAQATGAVVVNLLRSTGTRK